ncbi:two pore calcium channel protein 1 isoform X1 [Ixodes scapularis]|uniref:two pore calcium channel protein 1 isoform X1 n=2 Tax=Ixodes scapularis TaxID=6945 RepID=UPI001A9FE631|nr:two pore calcium channel protein 1 isoform X1 [Ixodes scapularis]
MAHLRLGRLQISDSSDGDRDILVGSDLCASYDSTEVAEAGHSWSTALHGVDVPYDLSNSEELTRSHNTELNSPCGEIPPDRLAKCWQLNYHEAAIFLEEGQNNDKLDFHPCSHAALPAYLVVHNRLFYCLDLLSAVVLMSLALMEEPALPGLDVPIAFHVAVELLALCVVAAELVMKLRWLGLRPFFAHKRTVFKLTILLLMFVEALVVAARQTNHFRVLRALRPIFLIDNHYLGGVRRLTRQILQSLPPVFDMLVILFFFMTMFAILAYHMFAAAPEQYFSTLYDSFMNLFVLLTTSNFPDVMIPYYARSKWASLFFVVFLLVHLYFLMNLVLAVVYERFSSLEKDKFRKLLLHRRKACQQAFRLLVNRTSPSCLYFCHFEGLMRYYKPRAKRREVYLMFKTMDVSRNGFLSQEDFLQVYEASTLSWERKWSDSPWFSELKRPCEKKLFQGAYRLITWKWSNVIIYMVIAASFMWHIVEITELTHGGMSFLGNGKTGFSAWLLIGLLAFYVTEMLLKIAAFGVSEYFHKGWNKFDFVIILAAIVLGSVGAFLDANLLRILVFRSLRLLKLFQLKKSYHDVLGTVFILMPRFLSVGLVLIVVYYFFAIIGIEVFSGYQMEDCCKNTTVEVYFATNTSSGPGYFYLMNFQNVAYSYVTLFALMAVNNWFIIMDGYAAVTSEFSRLFFMSFYLITMVVLQIVVAFVLEAFIFRIQYKMKIGRDSKEDNLVRVETRMSKAEIALCSDPTPHPPAPEPLNYATDAAADTLVFRGVRWRTKFSFCLKMYAEEVKEWLDHAELEERRSNEWLILNVQNREGDSTALEAGHESRRTFTL